MIYLRPGDLAIVAERAIGPVIVRDEGLLASALARVESVVYGVESYPTLEAKAAALVHSIVKNDALVDGNKRLGLASLIAFLGVNGHRLTWTNDEAYDVIMAIADGSLEDVADIASRIAAATEPR